MLKNKPFIRPSATAIAAVLALSSTPLLAQEAVEPAEAPAPADPLATTASEPAPAAETETVTTTSVTETTATADAAPVVKSTTSTVKRTTAKAAPARSAAPTASATSSAAPANASPVDPVISEATPVAPLAAESVQPEPMATESTLAAPDGDTVQYALGGAIAALLLGGTAVAASRRRRRALSGEDNYEIAPAPVVADRGPQVADSAIGANRSAFAWGKDVHATPAPVAVSNRLTPTEQAKRGPTPENPYLSLKKRMKRAAFFEDRDRAAAAGKAVPVARSAGLPETAVAKLRSMATPAINRPVFQPA